MNHTTKCTLRFQLECWGNGLSYELINRCTQMSVFVQGDDASRFEDEREETERAFPDKDDDYIFMWLWDQCEYGALAQPLSR